MSEIGLALLAGMLSTLSPCVLPLLPIVFGVALTEHRFGPAALAAGLTLSYVTIGLFVATLGFAIGLDPSVLRYAAATMLVVIGGVLLVPAVQTRLAVAGGPIGTWVQSRSGAIPGRGLGGQFAVGILLGVVWSPCVGPTLGAASVLAAQGKDLTAVAIIMLTFGVGAALPLLALGLLSREVLMRWRHRLLATGRQGRMLLGVVLLATGVFILTGYDKTVETWAVNASPAWLTELTTRF